MGTTGHQDGLRIRLLRVERGINVTTLASRLGIRRQHLSNIERRNKAASLDLLIKIARELDVPIGDLIRQDDADDEPNGQAAA